MKLAYDAKRLFHNATGLGNYSRTLLANIVAEYPSDQYHLYSADITGSRWKSSFSSPNFIPKNYSGNNKSYWRSYGITRELEAEQIDIYHGLSNELPFNIKKSNVKSVVTIHDMIYYRRPQDFKIIDRNIYHQKTKRACISADVIVAISEQTKSDIIDILRIPEQKVKVVYQSCSPLYFQPQTKETVAVQKAKLNLPDKYILNVGTYEQRKNQWNMIEAYATLPNEAHVPLLLVGRGKFKRQLQQLARKLGVADKVQFRSDITNNQDMQSLYQLATCFVYPSLYEGFGIPVIEAILSGTPVITSSTTSLPEAAGPHCTLVDPTNIEAIAAAMEQSILNPESLKEKVELSKTYVLGKFAAQQTARDMMAVYQSLL